MGDFLEDLKEYFENTPQDIISEDWAKTEEYDQSGILVDDFLEFCLEYKFESKISNNIVSSYSPSFNSGFFIN